MPINTIETTLEAVTTSIEYLDHKQDKDNFDYLILCGLRIEREKLLKRMNLKG